MREKLGIPYERIDLVGVRMHRSILLTSKTTATRPALSSLKDLKFVLRVTGHKERVMKQELKTKPDEL